MPNEPIPELIIIDERSKRQTTEFCTSRQDGYRCMLVKGHPGDHETLAKAGALSWATSSE